MMGVTPIAVFFLQGKSAAMTLDDCLELPKGFGHLEMVNGELTDPNDLVLTYPQLSSGREIPLLLDDYGGKNYPEHVGDSNTSKKEESLLDNLKGVWKLT